MKRVNKFFVFVIFIVFIYLLVSFSIYQSVRFNALSSITECLILKKLHENNLSSKTNQLCDFKLAMSKEIINRKYNPFSISTMKEMFYIIGFSIKRDICQNSFYKDSKNKKIKEYYVEFCRN